MLQEKDLGENVGILNQKKLTLNLKADNKRPDKLKLKYWLEKADNVEDGYIKFKIANRYKKYFLPELQKEFKHPFKEFRFKEIQEELFKVRNITKCKYFSDKIIQTNFWLFRGFTEEEAKIEIAKFQSKFGKKGGKSIPSENRPQNITYWLKRGYSEQEAKEKVKERQSTFSLEKCIQKYGKEEGIKVFQERQNKWQNTLNSKSDEEINDINKRKNPYIKYSEESKDEYFKRISEKYLKHYINEMNSKNVKINLNKIKLKFSTLNNYLEMIINNYKNTNLKYFYKPEDYYNSMYILKNVISKNDFCLKIEKYYDYKIVKTKFSYCKRVKEGLLRSSNEILFYNLLKENNINFYLDKQYPNSKMRYDFYLPDYDMYIEIAGMMEIEEYAEKMRIKKDKFNSMILLPDMIIDFFENLIKGNK